MGQTILALAKDDPKIEISGQCDLGDAIGSTMSSCDVAIDFSHPGATEEVCSAAVKQGKALVIGTTGHSTEQRQLIEQTAGSVPVVFASNFSVGVNALFALTRRAAEILGNDFTPQISETHHTRKKDAPSGTAKTLAEILSQSGKPDVSIESIRQGEVVGEHTIIFSGPEERLELTHRAGSREIFARGALRAAEWIADKPPGFYSMQDVLGI